MFFYRSARKEEGVSLRPLFASGRARILTVAFAAVIFALAFPFEAGAGADGESNPYKGKVDVVDALRERVGTRVDEAVEGAFSKKKISDRGFLLEGVMSNQWIVTRSVVNGFGNIDGVIGFIKSDDVRRATVVDSIISYYMQKNSAWRDLGDNKVERNAEGLRRLVNEASVEYWEAHSHSLDAQNEFTEQLTTLKNAGFFGGGAGSIMDKTMMIGAYLLGISLMARLMYMAYESIVKETPQPLAWFRVFFKFALFFLLIMFMKNMIMFGISMSDNVRNLISNSAFGDANSAGDIVGKLLRAKVDYLGIDPAISLVDLFSKTASMFIAQILGWLSYFIAAAVLFVIVLLGDIMMSITAIVGPIICAMSLMPSFEDNLGNWFKGYMTLLFYGPLAAVYSVMLVAILTIGLDTSALSFIIISISYIIGATNVPNMAKSLSGTVLAGLAIGLASMPMKFATGALGAAGGGVARTVGAGAANMVKR